MREHSPEYAGSIADRLPLDPAEYEQIFGRPLVSPEFARKISAENSEDGWEGWKEKVHSRFETKRNQE